MAVIIIIIIKKKDSSQCWQGCGTYHHSHMLLVGLCWNNSSRNKIDNISREHWKYLLLWPMICLLGFYWKTILYMFFYDSLIYLFIYRYLLNISYHGASRNQEAGRCGPWLHRVGKVDVKQIIHYLKLWEAPWGKSIGWYENGILGDYHYLLSYLELFTSATNRKNLHPHIGEWFKKSQYIHLRDYFKTI